MGHRGDFYIIHDGKYQWLGSIAFDSWPDKIPIEIRSATDMEKYIGLVREFIKSRDDGTFPDQGWPWPWKDSNTTDYAYVFFDDTVLCSCRGSDLIPVIEYDGADTFERKGIRPQFPNMESIQNQAIGIRSGMIWVGKGFVI